MTDELKLREKKCVRCGKILIARDDDYAYKRNIDHKLQYFCSWHCLRDWEIERGTKIARRERIQQAIRDGLTTSEIAVLLTENRATIDYWRRKMEEQGNA